MIRNKNMHPDATARTEYFWFDLSENTATAAIADTNVYVPVPYNCRVIEIAATHNTIVGAGNSGSASIRFYRANSASIASATTTSLLASGAITFSSGTAVGTVQTATLNTAQVTGRNAGMVVSAGTTLLIAFDNTATSAVNYVSGYLKVVLEDEAV